MWCTSRPAAVDRRLRGLRRRPERVRGPICPLGRDVAFSKTDTTTAEPRRARLAPRAVRASPATSDAATRAVGRETPPPAASTALRGSPYIPLATWPECSCSPSFRHLSDWAACTRRDASAPARDGHPESRRLVPFSPCSRPTLARPATRMLPRVATPLP